MDDERTLAEQVADEAAETIDDTDIEQAEDRIGEDVAVDDDEVRDEIRDEDDVRDDRLDQILDRVDAIGRHIDERIDGVLRVLLDSGMIITDAAGAATVDDIDEPAYRAVEDLDLL